MIVAYIAHPIGGDVENNLTRIRSIIYAINVNEPEVVPFAPYLGDCMALDDDIPEHRARGIKNDQELMKRGFIDEVRLYGNRISQGMKEEIYLALTLDIKIVPMTPETKQQYRELLNKLY